MAAGERLKLLMESQKGKPNGVAGLNESGKVPSGQLPAMDYVPTSRKVNGKALTADITLSAADTGAIPVAEKGATGGVATLDDSGKVPREQLPAMNYDPAGSAEAVQDNLNAHTNNKSNPHGVTAQQVGADPAGSASAVQGNLNTHTSNKNNPHGVTAAQVGTYEAEKIMASGIPAMFGLGAGAVPSDVLAYLGKYAQHWWRRRTPAISGYVEVKEKVSKMYTIVGLDRTVKYSKNIKIDKQTGAISLVNPKSLTCVRNTYGPTDFMSTLCAESPLYFTAKGNNDYETLYYLPSKSTYYDRSWTENPYTLVGYYNSNTNVMYVEIASSAPDSKKASLVTSFYNNGEPGEWEYLQSSDRSAYPDSGEQDGYEYQYLGVPFDNAVTSPKIATGYYVGTGTYGQDNPNSLTLEFRPQIVIIHGKTQDANNPSYDYGYTIMIRPATRYETIVTNAAMGYSGTIIWGNNEVSWFVEGNSGIQFNLSGEQYEYVAIG